jgi:hypothetical protein
MASKYSVIRIIVMVILLSFIYVGSWEGTVHV